MLTIDMGPSDLLGERPEKRISVEPFKTPL